MEKPVSSRSLAHSGNQSSSHALSVSKDYQTSQIWVVDDAIDHMTNSSHYFTKYTPCPGNQKIKLADGTLASIAGKRTTPLTPSLLLKYVLHVPKLTINLLSIHKLTKDLNCKAVFLPNHCVFQELVIGNMIGLAKERERTTFWILVVAETKVDYHYLISLKKFQ
ncbi:LOW QUALITY PROTEIN: hypothetical protein PanWU01x14_314000 [Parasponia andersonii]|uniref:Retrovirus-related Pol polyprotein from transposon TNT 1-94-like beta-barrel domain-containing protein n=1 Tax=Parasponia andersonii TaxID=3476 RepID=A0A2P5ANX2_PARAD|nr:LOW QUALITY PROTEIN: hypothetical protein PanWU01x14_314000 [Parasponia andersonii]